MSNLLRNIIGSLMILIRKDREDYGKMMRTHLDNTPVVKEADDEYTWVILGKEDE